MLINHADPESWSRIQAKVQQRVSAPSRTLYCPYVIYLHPEARELVQSTDRLIGHCLILNDLSLMNLWMHTVWMYPIKFWVMCDPVVSLQRNVVSNHTVYWYTPHQNVMYTGSPSIKNCNRKCKKYWCSVLDILLQYPHNYWLSNKVRKYSQTEGSKVKFPNNANPWTDLTTMVSAKNWTT